MEKIMFHAKAIRIPQESFIAKINNNPIDIVFEQYNQIMSYSGYQIQIILTPYLEQEGFLGRWNYFHHIIEITSTRDIFFTAGILAHELAHILDFNEKGLLRDYIPSLPLDFNTHDDNWKKWYDLLSPPIKDLYPSPIKLEIEYLGTSGYIEPSEKMQRVNIDSFE